MKKLMVALLILVAFSNLAAAQMFIGIFADDTYAVCYEDAVPYENNELIIAAYLGDEIPGITAAEFGVEGWLEDLGYPDGSITVAWNTTLVIGDAANGVALAFQTPVVGPYALLGNVTITPFSDTYINGEHKFIVIPAPNSDVLALVDDAYETHAVEGGEFTFNCVDVEFCPCFDDETATESTTWSSVKSLF